MSDSDIEKAIERKKRYIKDYLRIAEALGINEEERARLLDMLLSDLSKLMSQREQ